MSTNNLYGEFDSDSFNPTKNQEPPPPQEVKIVQVKSDNDSIPFRWKVASDLLCSIVQNHDYSSAISRTLSSKHKEVTRELFQNEVGNIAINFADSFIKKLEETTIKTKD
jgi:hypothetical protein